MHGMTYQRHITINVSSAAHLEELTEEERELFNFLCLLVDIQYRRRYGDSIEWSNGQGYSKYANEGALDEPE